jgi:hypothetical protein
MRLMSYRCRNKEDVDEETLNTTELPVGPKLNFLEQVNKHNLIHLCKSHCVHLSYRG